MHGTAIRLHNGQLAIAILSARRLASFRCCGSFAHSLGVNLLTQPEAIDLIHNRVKSHSTQQRVMETFFPANHLDRCHTYNFIARFRRATLSRDKVAVCNCVCRTLKLCLFSLFLVKLFSILYLYIVTMIRFPRFWRYINLRVCMYE